MDAYSKKFYSAVSRLYDLGLHANGYKRGVDYFVSQLPFLADQSFRVLDAGCGTGLYTLAVAKRFTNAEITAFDLNPDMLRQLQKTVSHKFPTAKITTMCTDLHHFGLSDDHPFDLIITGGVLEHSGLEKSVKHLTQYLAPRGYFLNSPVKQNPLGRWIGVASGFIPYSHERNIKAFNKAGLELMRVVTLPYRYLPISLVKEAHLFRKA